MMMCPYCCISYSEGETCFCLPPVCQATAPAPQVAAIDAQQMISLESAHHSAAPAESARVMLARKARARTMLAPKTIVAAAGATRIVRRAVQLP